MLARQPILPSACSAQQPALTALPLNQSQHQSSHHNLSMLIGHLLKCSVAPLHLPTSSFAYSDWQA